MKVWLGLLVLRISWVLMPQTGYIHPDEFFQTIEVVAGDALDVSVERTWEFNQSFPLRSILLPRLLFHPPFRLLKLISENTNIARISAWHVLCASRLTMGLLSVLLDVCLGNICADLNISSHRCLVLLASSYVTLTYLTHTFSNSIEALLLAAVIMLIIRSVKHEIPLNYKISLKTDKEKDSDVMDSGEKRQRTNSCLSDSDSDVLSDSYGMLIKLHSTAYDLHRRKRKESEEIPPSSETEQKVREDVTRSERSNVQQDRDESRGEFYSCALLAILNTAGIFNRPTFVLFSVFPFLWWISQCFKTIATVFHRLTIFIIVSMVTAVVFCMVDTLYYSNMSLGDLADFDNVLAHVVFTPLNFILYNTKFENLADHGRHPFYLHCLVNIPLLFGPLAFYLFKGLFKSLRHFAFFLFRIKKGEISMEESTRSVSPTVLLGFIFAPVVFLSVFPHQEPRFLIPLLPLVILYVVASKVDVKQVESCPKQPGESVKQAESHLKQPGESVKQVESQPKQPGESVKQAESHLKQPGESVKQVESQPKELGESVKQAESQPKQLGEFPKLFWVTFCLFNISLSGLYGVLHQGGIIPCLAHLQELTHRHQHDTSFHIIFSHTYMPPKHPLLINRNSNLHIHDLKGSSFSKIHDLIFQLRMSNLDQSSKSSDKILIIMPGTLLQKFKQKYSERLALKTVEKFFPHLSFEDPPIIHTGITWTKMRNMLSLFMTEIEDL